MRPGRTMEGTASVHQHRRHHGIQAFCCIGHVSQRQLVFLLLGVLSQLSGLLASSLQVFTDHACEGEILHMQCPPSTTVHVQKSVYGRTDQRICPTAVTDLFPSQHATNHQGALSDEPIDEDTNCQAPKSHQKVVEECDGKRSCRLLADISTFRVDPCPGTTKYLQVTYKCRPTKFHPKVVCEGENMRIKCKRGLRIGIYSAMFGYTSQGRKDCQAAAGRQECQTSYSLEQAMTMCHGKRKCNIPATTATFGKPCEPGQMMYLSIVYTCIEKRTLKKIYTSDEHEDYGGAPKSNDFRIENNYGDYDDQKGNDDEDDHSEGPSYSTDETQTINVDGKSNDGRSDNGKNRAPSSEVSSVHLITEWVSIGNFVEAHKEKFILVFVLTVALCLVAFFVIIVVQLFRRRHHLSGQDDEGGGGGYEMVGAKSNTYHNEDVLTTDFSEHPHADARFNGRTFRNHSESGESPTVNRSNNYARPYYS